MKYSSYLRDRRKKLILEEFITNEFDGLNIFDNNYNLSVNIIGIDIISLMGTEEQTSLYLRHSYDSGRVANFITNINSNLDLVFYNMETHTYVVGYDENRESLFKLQLLLNKFKKSIDE